MIYLKHLFFIVVDTWSSGKNVHVREYKNGVQVGVETSYYSNGNKRIELIYENRKVVSMRQWDIDGGELE